MATIDTQDEALLMEAIKQATDLVESGLEPTQAIGKVASELRLTPGRIRAICTAYNTGQQLNQFHTNDTALGKFATFALADPEEAIASVFGKEAREKAAAAASIISPDYQSPPAWLPSDRSMTKAASAPIQLVDMPPESYRPDPVEALHKAYGSIDREKRAAEELRRQAADLKDQLTREMTGLIDYFRKHASDRLTFDTVEQAATAYFGHNATSLLDVVHGQLGRLGRREKRAATYSVQAAPVDLAVAPFDSIQRCIKLAQSVHTAQGAARAALAKLAGSKEEHLRPFGQAGRSQPPPARSTGSPVATEIKQASLFGQPALGAAVGSMLTRGVGGMPKTRDELVQDAVTELDDPNHQNELRRIRANAMLTRMLTDPDDPLSGQDPDRVLREYNEISQMSPLTSEQPGAVRSLLHRRLQGNVQPFEAKELAELEKSLKATRQVPGTRPTGNESLLG